MIKVGITKIKVDITKHIVAIIKTNVGYTKNKVGITNIKVDILKNKNKIVSASSIDYFCTSQKNKMRSIPQMSFLPVTSKKEKEKKNNIKLTASSINDI